jgi:hypothetical protein
MQEAQANLKQAAVDFLDAAQRVAATAGQAPADPLDAVDTGVLELGDLEPAIGEAELEVLKRELARQQLLPATVLELVSLARQVAAVLQDV